MKSQELNGYQIRTRKTKAQLLAAAEEVFAKEGFEAAQMDSIARVAGRSKGAIYAHYTSKDDLFLALFEHRTRIEFQRLCKQIAACENRKQALRCLKDGLIQTMNDRNWLLLTIEAKLYALRHPEMRERWLQANQSLRSTSNAEIPQRQEAVKVLFGNVAAGQRAEMEARILAFRPLVTGLILEAEFEPKLLTRKRLSKILNEIASALLHVPEYIEASRSEKAEPS